MLSFIVDLLKDEMKRHPHMFLFSLLLGAGILGYSYRVFAQQTDVNKQFESLTMVQDARAVEVDKRFYTIEHRIDEVEQVIDQRHYEQRLASVDTEIFDLERLAESKQATDRDLSRLSNLMIERGEILRKLNEVATGVYR